MYSTNKPLKALLLVGGFGTRLRPLTLSKAKPLIEFINKPILEHQIEALKKVGVNEVILAINYQPDKMKEFLLETEKKYNIKVTCSIEEVPLGTGGPIGLAKKYWLSEDSGEEIFVFNSDVTCEFPLSDMLAFHRFHKKEGTICVTKVKDPSRYGVILSDSETHQIKDFIEKPQQFIGDNINAGLYIFNKKFLVRVNPVPTSLERDIYPIMAKEGELYVFLLKGFWADIGQPKDYLTGTKLFLEDLKVKSSSLLQKSNAFNGNVVIDPSTKIDEECLIGPNVVLGKNVIVKKGARIKDSVIWDRCIISEYSYINNSVIGWGSHIGKWARIEGLSVFGEDVVVKDEVFIKECVILPNVAIKTDRENQIILN